MHHHHNLAVILISQSERLDVIGGSIKQRIRIGRRLARSLLL